MTPTAAAFTREMICAVRSAKSLMNPESLCPSGIPAYRAAFFTHQYSSSHPDDHAVVAQLKSAIDAQVVEIQSCLDLHAQICPESMLPFHESLEMCKCYSLVCT